MNTLFKSRLFRKMLSIVVMCLLMSQTTMTLINIQRLEAKYLHSFQFNARAVAIQFEELILDSLDWGGQINEIGTKDVHRMDMLFSHPQFQKILTHMAVVDTDGRILSQTSHSTLPSFLEEQTYQHVTTANGVYSERNGKSFDTFVPIWHEEKVQGYIWVGFAADLIDEVVEKDMWQMILEDTILTLGFFLIFLFGFTIGIHKHVIRPIQCVIQRIQYIKESSDTSIRIPIISGDEIGYLANQFNQMMEGIEKAKAVLQNMLNQQQKREQEELRHHHNLGMLLRSTQDLSTQICVALDGNDWRDVEAIARQAKPLRKVIHHNYSDTLNEAQSDTVLVASSPELQRQATRQHIAGLACDIVHIAHKMPRMMEDWQKPASTTSDSENPLVVEHSRLYSENRHLKLLLSMYDHYMAHYALGRKKVLVVGWETSMRQKLSNFLEITYFDQHAVPDAKSCLELLLAARFAPDIIIIEIALPGMNGVVLGSKLRTIPRYESVPILFFGEPYWEESTFGVSMSAFLAGEPDIQKLDAQLWKILTLYHYSANG